MNPRGTTWVGCVLVLIWTITASAQDRPKDSAPPPLTPQQQERL